MSVFLGWTSLLATTVNVRGMYGKQVYMTHTVHIINPDIDVHVDVVAV